MSYHPPRSLDFVRKLTPLGMTKAERHKLFPLGMTKAECHKLFPLGMTVRSGIHHLQHGSASGEGRADALQGGRDREGAAGAVW